MKEKERNGNRQGDFDPEKLEELTRRLDAVSAGKAEPCSHACPPPDRRKVVRVIKALQALLFPMGYMRENSFMNDASLLQQALTELREQVATAIRFDRRHQQNDTSSAEEEAQELTLRFAERLPEVKRLLMLDIEALYEGDPAARHREEIMICYPGFYAISIYRMAHELYLLKTPLIPRIMTEFAHEKTGIDIHPGATIGEYFFIDHGTGIVVGETTVIGSHVKLYQGVTLGAKSFELDEQGNPVKGIKRHPNIGDHVVIYANATILGGRTTIGEWCVIGGNSWLTHSVKPGSRVSYQSSENQMNREEGES